MSEVENVHYISKEMHDSLKHPEAVYKELDKTGKKLYVLHDCDDCKHQDRVTDYDNFSCELCDYDEGYDLGLGGPTGWSPKEEDNL